MGIQKAREKFAEINLKEGFYTEEELSITNLGFFECTAAEQDFEKWWECLIYYVEPMLQAQKVAVPDGFVLVSKEMPESFDEALYAYSNSISVVDGHSDGFIPMSDIDHSEIWKLVIEAKEPTND